MSAKNAILKAMIQQELMDLFVKTDIHNVVVDDYDTTLAYKLAEMIAAINKKLERAQVQEIVQKAVNDLINGAPGTADTLKELHDLIVANKNVADALQQAIGTKVDKVAGKGLSTNDLTDALLQKLNHYNPSYQHTHSNKALLDGITTQNVNRWTGNSTITIGTTAPSDMEAQDLFIQIVQ